MSPPSKESESVIGKQQREKKRKSRSLKMGRQMNKVSKSAQVKITAINFTVREKWIELVSRRVESQKKEDERD